MVVFKVALLSPVTEDEMPGGEDDSESEVCNRLARHRRRGRVVHICPTI
jgi:hypothetical protein